MEDPVSKYEADNPQLTFKELCKADNWELIYRSAMTSLLELGANQCNACKLWFSGPGALQFCVDCRGQMYCGECRHQCVRCQDFFCFDCKDSSMEWESQDIAIRYHKCRGHW